MGGAMMKRTDMAIAMLLMAIALAGCTAIESTPNVTVTNASDYFWPWQAANYALADSTGIKHELSLSLTGGPLSMSDSRDSGNSILLTNSAGDVQMKGADSKSFFALPRSNDFFSIHDTVAERIIHVHPIAMIAPEGIPFMLGTDSGFVYQYDPKSNSCTIDPGSPLAIDVFGVLPGSGPGTNTLYAGSLWGGVWMRNTGAAVSAWTDKTGNLPAGPVTALVATTGHDILAAVDGVGIFKLTTTGWTQVTGSTTERVNAMFAVPSAQTIYIATASGRIGILKGVTPISWRSLPLIGGQIDPVQTIGGYGPGLLLAGTRLFGIYESTDGGNTWVGSTSIAPPIDARGICYYPTLSAYLVLSRSPGKLFGIGSSGSGSTTVKSIASGVDVLAAKAYPDSVFVLTTEGLHRVSMKGIGDDIATGDFTRTIFDDTKGPLILLRSNMTRGSRWRAGTLIQKPNSDYESSFAIYAKVLDQLDSLHVGPTTYLDAILVRYAFERTEGQPVTDTLPYWVMYYVRNVGPVMLEEVEDVGGKPVVVYRLTRQ